MAMSANGPNSDLGTPRVLDTLEPKPRTGCVVGAIAQTTLHLLGDKHVRRACCLMFSFSGFPLRRPDCCPVERLTGCDHPFHGF